MGDMLWPFLAYVFVTTFTPGPNNIASASMGMAHGYQKTLRFLGGIATGFFLILMICGLLTETVTSLFPKVDLFFRIAGTGYMVWLAVMILLPKKDNGRKMKTSVAFGKGFILQVVNPKVMVYSVTVFSSFLVKTIDTVFQLTLAALFLTFIGFLSVSAWALFGSVIKRYLQKKTIRIIFNTVMALLLLYSAASIAGIHKFL